MNNVQYKILKSGVENWNAWRRENPGAWIDLLGADLLGANLREADLRGADLLGADLLGANLRGANLRGANLREADLRGADLRWADLEGANLQGANLREADLQDANLREADLEGANLRGANLQDVSLLDAYLRGAKLDYKIQEGLLERIAEIVLEDPEKLKMGAWHSCGTTHCIAGWACELAEGGKELEKKFGTQVAGLLLLGPEAHSHFFDDQEEAIEWLKSKI